MRLTPDRVKAICSLYGALVYALGNQELDVLLKDAQTSDALIFNIARSTGVIL